jgi:3-(3-hydroxy-phenyl)propionate hydroxylase
VVGLTPLADGVRLEVACPDGAYAVEADWVIAADGARSALRKMLGLRPRGRVFEDRFLIADVRMKADLPAERRFWFDPPFHAGRSALLHRQAEGVWRIDLQLGPEADAEEERKPERLLPRLMAMLGEAGDFELDWVSVYTFQCRRLERFRHGRTVFAGDSAHQVTPFGARGGNGGIQDADNLVWKLAAVLRGRAPESLVDSYDEERVRAADENILQATRSVDFIAPREPGTQALRDAVLSLARTHPALRGYVNSGRLSVPASLRDGSLQTADGMPGELGAVPGDPCPDAPVVPRGGGPAWLLNALGHDFQLLLFAEAPEDLPDRAALRRLLGHCAGLRELVLVPDIRVAERFPVEMSVFIDPQGLAAGRYGGRPGSVHLIRPDQHVAARWPRFDEAAILDALDRACGRRDPAVLKGSAA